MTDPPNLEVVVFTAAQHLPPGKRTTYLDEVCAEDAELRERVEALLQAHEQATGFLEHAPVERPPVSGNAETPHPTDFNEQVSARIGPYKLLQQLGEGGCGVVYLAEQQEPVRRRVALKVIKLGMDTRAVIARFEAERQALALMDHPNIAKVLDAGTTDAGRPFFVMELVKGIRITDYCDQAQLATSERLRLFIQVCQAIQHAHQKGIVHRDIKPSNVLVASQDGTPVPKVIDFGIAKAIDQRLTDKTVFTAFEQFIGTPAYMSPEQAELSGLDIDTRSDIYSLGVLLYELLTGRTPFESKELAKGGLDDLRRRIREQEPKRPSTRLELLADAELATVARQRRTDPAKLRGLVHGDLDWLVMKCLEKDRSRRYETANGLAMDVQRYLASEPIVARPPSRVYRFKKLVQRNRLAFAAAAAVLVALLVGLVSSLYLLGRAGQAEQRALVQAAKSRHVADLLKRMLAGVRPEVANGRDTRLLREILDQSVNQLGTDLRDQPDVEVELRGVAGQVYYAVGEYAKADAMIRRALELQEALRLQEARGGTADRAYSQLLFLLAEILWDEGNLGKAEAVHKDALALRRELFGESSVEVADSLNDLGLVRWSRSDFAEAENLIRRALILRRKVCGDQAVPTAESLGNLGLVQWERGELDEAKENLLESLALRRRAGADAEAANSLHNLASVQRDCGDLAGARESLDAALGILNRLTPGHPHVRLVEARLAVVLRRQAAQTGDLALMRQALRLNPADPLTAEAMSCALAKSSLIPLATNSSAPRDWRFATSFPPTNWMSADFAEQDWPTSSAVSGYPTCSPRSDRAVCRITNVWARSRFEFPSAPAGRAVLLLHRNQDSELFVNGVAAGPLRDWADTETLWPVSDVAEATLQAGGNLLAVHAQDFDGGATIGAEMFLAADPQCGWRRLLEEFDGLLKDQPQRAELYAARANAEARLAQWQSAAASLTRAVELNADREVWWYQLGALLVTANDLPAYRRHCQAALEHFARPENLTASERVARLALLLPSQGRQLETASRLADEAAAIDYADKGLVWRQLAKGLAEYRRAHFDEAISWVRKARISCARTDLPGWGHERERNVAVMTFSLEAMSEYQRDRSSEARACLEQGARRTQPDGAMREAGDSGRDWADWLTARILRKEAKELIEGQAR